MYAYTMYLKCWLGTIDSYCSKYVKQTKCPKLKFSLILTMTNAKYIFQQKIDRAKEVSMPLIKRIFLFLFSYYMHPLEWFDRLLNAKNNISIAYTSSSYFGNRVFHNQRLDQSLKSIKKMNIFVSFIILIMYSHAWLNFHRIFKLLSTFIETYFTL